MVGRVKLPSLPSSLRSKHHFIKLVKSAKNVLLAVSIKDGKRGIVKDIRSYNTKNDTYSITYLLPDNSLVKDTIISKYMREGLPTKLSTMERQYWLNQNSIPDRIKKFIQYDTNG